MLMTLALDINPRFNNETITIKKAKEIKFGELKFLIVGPTKRGLENLRREWFDWADKHEQTLGKRYLKAD
jgi:hypothetical protein